MMIVKIVGWVGDGGMMVVKIVEWGVADAVMGDGIARRRLQFAIACQQPVASIASGSGRRGLARGASVRGRTIDGRRHDMLGAQASRLLRSPVRRTGDPVSLRSRAARAPSASAGPHR